MPPYAFMADRPLDSHNIDAKMRALKVEGVPYTDEMIADAKADLNAQADTYADGTRLRKHYGDRAAQRDFGGAAKVTEMDALVAYLQMLGTLVDFSKYHPERPENNR